ncbi:hypothetical protein D3C84_167040 [compost metagenome]
MASNLIKDRPSICTGLAHHSIADGIEWADVPCPVHQTRPEEERGARQQALHGVVALRVSQICQLGSCGQVVGRAIPDFRALGVLGSSGETPLEANAEQQRGGGEEQHRRRQATFPFEVGQDRVAPDRRDVESTYGTNAGHIGASIDAGNVDACHSGALQFDPVTAVLAPLHVIADRTGHRRPVDRHGGDGDALGDNRTRCERDAGRRRYHGDRNHADWSLFQTGAGVDVRELARVVLNGRDFEYTRLRPRHSRHPVQRHSQVIRVERPDKFALWHCRISDSDSHRAPRYGLHSAPFALAVGQVQDQPVAGLGLSVAVQGDGATSNCGDSPADCAARQQLVGHRDDVPRQWDATIETHLKTDGPVFGVGQQCPLTAALCLRLAGAANGADLQWVVAVTPLQLRIVHRGDVGVVVVRRVVVADQGSTVPGALRRARVGELAIDDVRPGVGEVEISSPRHVGQAEQLALRPVGHAAINRRNISQQRPGIGLALQVEVADETRLLSALSVWHQLIAILSDPVQLPFVDLPRLDPAAKPEAVTDRNTVGHPRRVIGPCLLEGSVPNAGIGAGFRIVIAGHLPFSGAAVDGHSRDVAELLGRKLDVEQCCVRIAQLRVDDFSEACDLHGVSDFVVVLVQGHSGDTNQPAAVRHRQINTASALVGAGGLTVDSLAQHLLIGAAIGGQLNLVLDPVAVHIATGIDRLQGGPGEAQAHGRQVGIADCSHIGRTAAQLDAE